MTNNQYERIERLLTDLLNLVNDDFSTAELQEVQDFIDVNEYGIALQTFVAIVLDRNIKIPEHAVVLCEKLAEDMSFSEEVNLQAIRKLST